MVLEEMLNLKLSVFTVMLPELSLDETAALLAEMGFNGVEWRVRDLRDDLRDKSYSFWGNVKNDLGLYNIEERAREIKQVCDSAGLELCSLGTYLSCSDYENIRKVARVAAEIGCPQFRVGTAKYDADRGYKVQFDETVEHFKVVEDIMKEYGVRALIETHMKMITPSPSAAFRLVSHFDPTCIGVILDPGNLVVEGYEDALMSIDILGEYLGLVHAKNMRWLIDGVGDNCDLVWKFESSTLRNGMADWGKIIAGLRNAGYSGFLSMEDFSQGNFRDKLEDNARYLRSLLSVHE